MQNNVTIFDAALILIVLALSGFVLLAIGFDDQCRNEGGEPVDFFECEGRND